MAFILWVFFVHFVSLCLSRFLLNRRRRRSRKLPLPPGSMGWPYFGETFKFYSQNPNNFFSSKEKEYGPIFKTHILGNPCVMVSSPQAAKLVLVTQSRLFKPTFPASKERMLGNQAIFFQHGDFHLKLRKLVLRALTPDSINRHLPSIDSIASASLRSLQQRCSPINSFHEMKTYAFEVALLTIFGQEKVPFSEEFKGCYGVLERGYNSMPINFPGTLFHKAMKARKRLTHMVAEMISARRKKKSINEKADLLGSFMDENEALSDEEITDNIIGLIFASRDTTASVLTWILKFLADHPAVLQSVTEEQGRILRRKKEGVLAWDDIKSMPLTVRVIHETMRLASVLSFTFREAVEDVDLDGYLIPKGWKVMPLFRNIHHSPHNFNNPHRFDPSRFQVPPKPNTYFPFGSGIHQCPGHELAKLEMLVLLHHLTTKYAWTPAGSQHGVHYGPFAIPCNGLPIRIYPKESDEQLL